MKKILSLICLFIFLLVLLGCEKRISLDLPAYSLTAQEAINIVKNTLNKKVAPEGYTYVKMLASFSSKNVVHVWEKEGRKELYLRYWSFDGDNLRVLFQISEDGLKYFVILKNNGQDTGDCFGYSNTMPVPKAERFDIYWSEASVSSCRQSVKYEFKNKSEAILFAQALKYLFIDHKIYDVLFELEHSSATELLETKSTETQKNLKKENQVTKSTNKKEEPKKVDAISNNTNKVSSPVRNNCSVDKILKMKEIGLTNSEIKSICK